MTVIPLFLYVRGVDLIGLGNGEIFYIETNLTVYDIERITSRIASGIVKRRDLISLKISLEKISFIKFI